MLVLTLALVRPGAADDGAEYAYGDTRALVALVERAADLVEAGGEAAFSALAEPGSQWFTDQSYFFAYTLDGVCLLNAASPGLVGRNLIDLHDMNGKPVIREITAVGSQDGADATGWVFYLWQEATQFSPAWKSAYVRKVAMPDGRTVVLGSGLYDMKIERVFIEDRIARAAALLASEGTDKAFAAFGDPAGPFIFLDTYVFVLDETGHTLVDPAFPDETGRDLSRFRDAVGAQPIAELMARLEHDDIAWIQYLWRPPGSSAMARKLIHAHKVTVEGKTLIVGTDYVLATPIWMRVEEGTPWRTDRPA